ncbi:vegetative cell wall protein gp1-like [Branchiostoma floridae]|uniref:Vegetative cell wall protein gp1-like n=1 Tax=Branchiostoma floridae TaxID=7739 RepID=A0A9J7LUN1_BRAFL|nr:vegetative cell wall protein gp1-like [Branchiostoma floridae]
MSPKKSKRSCKKYGILLRDHHHAKAGTSCTPPPAPTPSPDPPVATESPQIPDLETLQQQREDLQSAIQRARLAREVRDLEADLRELQLDITSGNPSNTPPAAPVSQLPGATPPVPPAQTPADRTPPPPPPSPSPPSPPPVQTMADQTSPPQAPTPPIVPVPAPAGTTTPANLQELRQHPQIQAAMQELTSSSLALDDLLSRPSARTTAPATATPTASPLLRMDQDPQVYLSTNTGKGRHHL